jgi:hypothetical protein
VEAGNRGQPDHALPAHTCSFKPEKPRPRVVSAALKAYAKLTTSADRGAVRDVSKLD